MTNVSPMSPARSPVWARLPGLAVSVPARCFGVYANLIEMDRSYYASIEVGRRNVSLSNLKKIADGFQISIAELMRGVS